VCGFYEEVKNSFYCEWLAVVFEKHKRTMGEEGMPLLSGAHLAKKE